jgi:hypothetical protein
VKKLQPMPKSSSGRLREKQNPEEPHAKTKGMSRPVGRVSGTESKPLRWGNTAYWEAAGLMLLGILLIVYRWRGTLLMLINPGYVNVALLAGLCCWAWGLAVGEEPKLPLLKSMPHYWGRGWAQDC